MSSTKKHRIAYLHGLYSYPKPEKVAILQKYSQETVYAPQINYENNPALFEEILQACQHQEVDFIVGSSAGGLLGFWLSQHLQIHSVLFNPPLYKSEFIQRPELQIASPSFFCQIIQGVRDEVVSPEQTRDYLEAKVAKEHYALEMIESLAHQIDLATFSQTCEKYL